MRWTRAGPPLASGRAILAPADPSKAKIAMSNPSKLHVPVRLGALGRIDIQGFP